MVRCGWDGRCPGPALGATGAGSGLGAAEGEVTHRLLAEHLRVRGFGGGSSAGCHRWGEGNEAGLAGGCVGGAHPSQFSSSWT